MENFSLRFKTRYQRELRNKTNIFVVEQNNGTHVNFVQCRHELKIKDGCQKPEVEIEQRDTSASLQNNNEIPEATHTFTGSNNSVRLV
jgi:hypothetical protein